MKSLALAQLIGYRDRINFGGVDAARGVYAELYSQGYNYAEAKEMLGIC
jgi:hypothetical protein